MASKSLSTAKVAAILFQARLHREGKLADFYADKAAIPNEGPGIDGMRAKVRRVYELKTKYGFAGYKKEIELAASERKLSAVCRRKEAMAEAGRNRGRSALDKAFDELPNRAAADQELSWVQSHPRMRRALHDILRDPDGERKPPKITVADITSPSNGACPSKAAFSMLLSWLASPKEFQKQLIAKQRDGAVKSGDGGTEASGIVADDGLANLKRVHEQFLLQQQAK